MTYRTTHFDIDVEFQLLPSGAVDINISPSAGFAIFEPAKIGDVYLNGNKMTAVEVHEDYDVELLDKLRQTLKLETVIPSTIYTFAELRIRRYEAELENARAALRKAQESLKEITIDPEQFDFGPAYGAAQQRQADAIRACATALRNSK